MIGAKPRACEELRVARFWACLGRPPADVQELARENYELLKANPYQLRSPLSRKALGHFTRT